MIWFNIKKLEKKLANDDFPETLGYSYLIIFLSLVTLLYFFPNNPSSGNAILKTLSAVSMLAVSFWGINRIIKVNKYGGNRDFFKRFLSLSFVTGVRLITGLIAFSLFARGAKYLLQEFSPAIQDGPFFGDFSRVALSAIVSVLFFQMLINSFRRVNEIVEQTSLKSEY